MRVVIPYAGSERFAVAPLADAIRAVKATGHDFDLLYCGHSDRAYFDWLSRLWEKGDTFAVVEQDIVIHSTALDELAACPHDWCGFPHMYGVGNARALTHSLGCVKFGADLIARNPDAMIRVGTMWDDRHPKRHWCRLDAWLQSVVLPGNGEEKHKHETVVRHLGNGCSHGCIPST